MEGRPKALHVQVGRTHIEVDAGVRSLDELRAHITSSCAIPPDEQKLICAGRTLTDVPPAGSKVMVLRCAAAAAAAAPSLKLTLREPNRGKFRTLEHPLGATVSSLVEIAERIFSVPPGSGALYSGRGKQLLRPDLTLADYALPDAIELFLVPKPPPADPNRVDGVGEAALPQCALDGVLPAEALKMLPAGALVALQPGEAKLTPEMLAAIPLSAVELPASLSAMNAVDAPAAAPPAPQPASNDAAAAAQPSAAPTTLRSGLLEPAGASPSAMLELSLAALSKAVHGADIPPTALPASAGRVVVIGRRGRPDGADSSTALESRCARVVDSLESRAVGADVPLTSASDDSWGAGLSKGFLNAPKRRRRKRAPPALPAQSAPQPASTSSPRDRCLTCARRLPLTASVQCKCRCSGLYCAEHLHTHECTFDFRGSSRRQLATANPRLDAPKRLSS